jgi:hypothetical protein
MKGHTKKHCRGASIGHVLLKGASFSGLFDANIRNNDISTAFFM